MLVDIRHFLVISQILFFQIYGITLTNNLKKIFFSFLIWPNFFYFFLNYSKKIFCRKYFGIYIIWDIGKLIAQLVENWPAMQETPVWFLGWEDPLKDRLPTLVFLGFPWTQLVKNPPAMQETWVRSVGWEDPLEKGKATHSSILAWRIPPTV